MDVNKIIRRTAYVVGGLVAVVMVILAVLAFVRIPIDLSAHKGLVESLATRSLGRTVIVHDRIAVTTSLRPVFTLEGLKIANPQGFKSSGFITMDTARIKVALLPLLRRKIHIVEFNVQGFNLTLEVNDRGEVNWAFRVPAESDPSPAKKSEPASETSGPMLTADTLVIKKLVFKDISVEYSRSGQARPAHLTISECTGKMPSGEPFTLSLKGEAFKNSYVTTIEIGSLKELIQDNRSRMEIKAEIADTHFEFSGDIDLAQALRTLRLKASVAGSNFSSLNRLTNLSLPPFKSYRAGGQLSLRKQHLKLSDFSLQVGKSRLIGFLNADIAGPRPVVDAELKAPLIQLNDFEVGDWSPEKGRTDQPQGQTATRSDDLADNKKRKQNYRITLTIDQPLNTLC